MIEAHSLTKRYGAMTAVDGLNFTVKPGEVLGFLGPNGAGKSTTMKMLSGFLTPTEGRASINGHDVQDAPLAARACLGYLPEGAPSYGEMTVTEFLGFIARARAIVPAQRRAAIAAVVERLGLADVLHQDIDTLSKGFRRRVGLAQAILHDPPVLILDEPTDGLDPNQKHEVRKLIRDMASDKIIIISTHILEEVKAVCNRAMIIARGQLLADATPQELIARSRYHNAVTLVLEAPEQAASVLSELPQVASAEIRDGELTVFPAGEGLFEAVSRVVAERQWAVAELRLEAGRLDEVFRAITSEEAR